MKITVAYVGSSLLAPLHHAEREINREFRLGLKIITHNFGATFTNDEWLSIENDLRESAIVFVIHVMDGENATRLSLLLDQIQSEERAVIVFNCMPELMRRTRMGKLDLQKILRNSSAGTTAEGRAGGRGAMRLLGTIASWMGNQARAYTARKGSGDPAKSGHSKYLKLVDRLPALLRFVPGAGRLRDVKNYLYLFCYFLQPTPGNIRAMVLYALKKYAPDGRLKKIKIALPETMPSVAIYHPDAPALFESFGDYEKWYRKHRPTPWVKSSKWELLDRKATIGLLLMRPQIISNTRKHYDGLIRAIEAEGLSVIPATSTLMDNREAVSKFFLAPDDGSLPRVSQVVSLTGFSFVGGPAMNDSEAAVEFLRELNIPYRSAVSLDIQTIEAWQASATGLNPVQAGMQIAIPEIDGATEPFVYGGMTDQSFEPVPMDDRCRRFARRLKNWNRLQTAKRDELKLALVIYCFPPNKGNMGTAADLDVFESVHATLQSLQADGYSVAVPADATALRDLILSKESEAWGATANVAYRMSTSEYQRLCPYADEVEKEWGPAPGRINSFGEDVLIQGVTCGNVFIGLQPTFGYEGDPMRMLMAKSGAPHHGFMAFYTYLQKVFLADAVVHVGTHGAMEFMPGKQVGMSGDCWPDRLIGELPNLYIYSVNNPSEGTIAKRRSYAELISYLTPPIENAGLYRELASLKDLVMNYRQSTDEVERERLFESIQECSRGLNLA